MSQRTREVLGEVDRPCGACGFGCLVAVETRSSLRPRDRFRAHPDRRVTCHDPCVDCGSTARLRTVNPRRVSGGDSIGPGYVVL